MTGNNFKKIKITQYLMEFEAGCAYFFTNLSLSVLLNSRRTSMRPLYLCVHVGVIFAFFRCELASLYAVLSVCMSVRPSVTIFHDF